MKKIVFFLSIQLIIFSSITMAASWKKISSWAESEVVSANSQELIPDVLNELDYTENISRKEFAAICVNLYEKLIGYTINEISSNPFVDTNDIYVLKAYSVGITTGTTETTFSPDALITREQMATMMTRALNKAGIDTGVDLEKTTKFADDADMH